MTTNKCDHENLLKAGVYELKAVSDRLEALISHVNQLGYQLNATRQRFGKENERVEKRVDRLRRDFAKESHHSEGFKAKVERRLSRIEFAIKERLCGTQQQRQQQQNADATDEDGNGSQGQHQPQPQPQAVFDIVGTMSSELKDLQERVRSIEANISLAINSKFQEMEERMDKLIEVKVQERLELLSQVKDGQK